MIAGSHSPSTKPSLVPSMRVDLSNSPDGMLLLYEQEGIEGPNIMKSKIKKNLLTQETLSRWIAPGFSWKIKTNNNSRRHRVLRQEGVFHMNHLAECLLVHMARRSLIDLLPELIECSIAPMGSLQRSIGSLRMNWGQQKLNIASELSV